MYNSIWYDSLLKPWLNPPAWIFPPVWIMLYCSIFIALILFTIKFSRYSKLKGYIFFLVQLILNLVWSPAFFMLKNIGLALIIVLFMDIFVLLTLLEFKKVSKLSSVILIPYFLWIIFATYLNIEILILN